ncbi:MAG: hypothetical protein AVDCRST_MAG11-161, partial [uncultured Gemmatimonadaceae bacterium]
VAAVGSAARPGTGGLRHVAVPAAALLVGVLEDVLLVRTALGPLRELERTAARVLGGDLAARVPASPVADPDMARVGAALNALLDALGAERARVRALAAEVIRSSDADRARVARELHDSTAQTLAALTLQAGSAARRLVSGGDDGLAEQLTTVRDLSVDALEEVRALSQTVHPRVLEDLGLRAALEELAQACGAEHGARVEVAADGDAGRLAPALSATIYRIAEQALADAAAHARDGRIVVRLTVTSTRASLEIADDGRALAADADGERRPGVGLFVMQERAALLDGVVRVERASGRGTRVAAEFPLLPPAAGGGPHPETA